MNFALSEDQAMVRDMLERFVGRRYAAGEHRAYRAAPTGYSAENMAMLAELGLFALPFAEDTGGMGGSLADLTMAMESLGRGLVVEPILSRIVLAARLLEATGSPAARAAWLEPAMTGWGSLALAHHERPGARPMALGADGCLSGAKSFVLDAVGVDAWIVTYRDQTGSPAGPVVIAAGTLGVETTPYRLADGSWAAEIAFDRVAVDPAEAGHASRPALDRVIAEAAVAAAGETLGIMQRLLDDTVAYIGTRQQFGQPIGKFQVVQHKAARMYIAVEQARSLVFKAALTHQDDAAWPRAVRSCQAFIADAALDLAHDAVQLHGGIGVTDELPISFGHRRLMVLRKLFTPGGPFALDGALSQAA